MCGDGQVVGAAAGAAIVATAFGALLATRLVGWWRARPARALCIARVRSALLYEFTASAAADQWA